MVELTLVSASANPIRALVESALHNETRLLEIAIRQTKQRILQFEAQYQLTTADFLARFRQNEFEHSFDFDDWIGESRMLTRLCEKLEILQGIQIVN